MSNDPSDVNPTPAVPLEYFQRNSGPWYLVMQFMARAGIVYSIIVIAGEVTELIYLAHQHLTLGGMITTYGPHLIVGYFPAVIAVFLVSGCRMALRLKPAGRSMIVWASLGMIGCYILMLAANEWDAYGYYQRVRGYTLGNTIFQMINSIFGTQLARFFRPFCGSCFAIQRCGKCLKDDDGSKPIYAVTTFSARDFFRGIWATRS